MEIPFSVSRKDLALVSWIGLATLTITAILLACGLVKGNIASIILVEWTLFSFWLFIVCSREQAQLNFDSGEAHKTLERQAYLPGIVENAAWIAFSFIVGDWVTLIARVLTYYMDHVLDGQIVAAKRAGGKKTQLSLRDYYRRGFCNTARTTAIAAAIVLATLWYLGQDRTRAVLHAAALGCTAWSIVGWCMQYYKNWASGGEAALNFSLKIPYCIIFCTSGWLVYAVTDGKLGWPSYCGMGVTLIVHILLINQVWRYKRLRATISRMLFSF